MRDQIIHAIALLWMAMIVIWWLTALRLKQTIQSREEWHSRMAVWVVWIAFVLLFGRGYYNPFLSSLFIRRTNTTAIAGLAITVIGLGFCIWARFYIGGNWSALIELKKDHELIQSGPYGIVRHPIYSGLMLATLGTAIAYGVVGGLISFALIVAAWTYKSRLEEAVLIQHFGARYEDYRRRVKGLIPFVW